MDIDITPIPVRHGQTPARRLHLPESELLWRAGRGFVVREAWGASLRARRSLRTATRRAEDCPPCLSASSTFHFSVTVHIFLDSCPEMGRGWEKPEVGGQRSEAKARRWKSEDGDRRPEGGKGSFWQKSAFFASDWLNLPIFLQRSRRDWHWLRRDWQWSRRDWHWSRRDWHWSRRDWHWSRRDWQWLRRDWHWSRRDWHWSRRDWHWSRRDWHWLWQTFKENREIGTLQPRVSGQI